MVSSERIMAFLQDLLLDVREVRHTEESISR